MNLKPEELIYKLQKQQPLPNAMLITGEEHYYHSRIMAELPEYVFVGVESADREITYFDKDTNLQELEGVINSYPFFCGKSLVIVRDEKLLAMKQESDVKKKQLAKMLQIFTDVPEYCTLVINVPKLDKRSKIYKDLSKSLLVCDCESVKPNNLASWLKAQAQEAGGSFDTDAIATIMEYLAPVDKAPLQLLQQEIAKLALYAGERKRWTSEDVETIFSALPEVYQYAFSNAVAEHKLLIALELLAVERKKGTNILLLCGSVVTTVRRLLRVRELLDTGCGLQRLMGELGMSSIFIVKKLAQQAKCFSTASLQTALQELVQLNVEIRQGGRQYQRLEEILVKLLQS